jgi:hypothetical protein
VVRAGRRQGAARERRQAVRSPGTVVTALSETRCDREYRSARTSAPGVVAGLAPCAYRVCDARTPLVVTRMQAVSAGPRRAPRSILPLAPSSCLNRVSRAGLTADAGGDHGRDPRGCQGPIRTSDPIR